MKILIYGTGAVGGYFGGKLASGRNNSVDFIARGNHDTLGKKGLNIKSIHGNVKLKKINVSRDVRRKDYDLILITVKSFDTDNAVKKLKNAAGRDTIIISIQNGISNYDKLVRHFGKKRVIRGFCRIAAEMKEGHEVHHTALGEIVAGEENGEESKRLLNLQGEFKQAGVALRISPDIKYASWVKFAWNSVFNTFTAASMLTVDKVIAGKESYEVCKQLLKEVSSIADAEGVELRVKDCTSILSKEKNRGIFKTSTLIDRQACKPMEYEAFAGEILRLGKKHGIDTPINKVLYSILKAV